MRSGLLGAVLLLLPFAHALYEEQAGILDWHKSNLGAVNHAQFAPRGRERVFVATEAAVVASLDTKDGSIVWRQVLESEDSIDALVLVPRPACVLTVSRWGTTLRAWNALDGTLLWERVVASTPVKTKAVVSILPDVIGDGSSGILVAADKKAQLLSAPKGRLVWTSSLSGTVLAAAPVSGSAAPQIALAVAESLSIFVVIVEAATGKEVAKVQLCDESDQVALSGSFAAALAGNKLCYLEYSGSRLQCKALGSLSPGLAEGIALEGFSTSSSVALKSSNQTVIVSLAGGGSQAAKLPGYLSTAAFEDSTEKGVLVGVVPGGDISVKTVNGLGTVAEGVLVPADLQTASQEPVRVRTLAASSRKVGEYGKAGATVSRVLLGGEDDSLLLVEGGAIVWRREEGLASVASTLFLDLPTAAADVEASYRAARPSLTDRVNAEVLSVKKGLGIIQPDEELVLKDINARLSSHMLPHKDLNGFRKLLLVLSRAGKLFGLHSGDGRVLWSTTLGSASNFSRMFLSATSRDPHQAPQVLLLGSSQGQSAFAILDAHTGQILDQGSLPGSLIKVLEQGYTISKGSLDSQAFALVFSDLTVQAFPQSAELRGPLHFWKHDASRGVLAGYKVAGGASLAVEQWSTAFCGPSSSVLSIAARDSRESVYSYAKVLGNRSMKLKYLNPNVIFVASGPPEGQAAQATAAIEAAVTVQLIDTISGQVIYSQALEGAKGPVNAVLSENWVVYSYYNSASQRFEIAVLEFYDVRPRDLSIPSLLLGNQSSTLSAFAPPPIEVLHQSYFTPVGIKAMAVTSTRKGITSKQLLIGTQSDQVYLLDKRFVDPRRPKGTPTADEKMEMLPPYAEELPFTPTLFASHKEAIEGLADIVSSPANLESTTLTLTYGLDMFFSRVQPSKTFDLLPDDFPFAMLVIVTVALLIGAFVLKRMEDNSAVKRKWA